MELKVTENWTPPPGRVFVFTVLILGAITGAGCGNQSADTEHGDLPSALASGVDNGFPEVVATVGDTQITMEQIRFEVGERLAQMENAYHRERHQVVNQAVVEAVRRRLFGDEAAELGVSVNQLFADEAGASFDVTDADVATWYQQNQSRLGGRTVEDLRGQIVELLTNTRREQALTRLEERLSEKYGVTYHLDPFRLQFDNEGAPAKGPEAAPITLVAFSDFECPFCGRFVPTLQQIESHYGDRIRIVYRQYPIPSLHPNAFKAAEASLCADEQGSFWEMHDLMFAEQDRLTVRDLKEKAGRLGMDQAAFDTCLDTGRHVEQVQGDQSAGRSVGITGTPALFVNGIEVEGGAVPFEAVAAVIDAELARTGS